MAVLGGWRATSCSARSGLQCQGVERLQGRESRMPGAAEASEEGVLPRGDAG